MKKRKWSNLILLAAAIVLLCGSYAAAGSVPDTGDPNEPACNPHSYTDLGNGITGGFRVGANNYSPLRAQVPGYGRPPRRIDIY